MSSAENGRLVWCADGNLKVWICPWCGSAERYDDPQLGDYVPYCEWCADDPEGGGEVSMVLHVAAPDSAWDAAPADPAEAVDRVLTSLSGDLHLERIEARDAVLAALGVPDVPQRPTPRDETT